MQTKGPRELHGWWRIDFLLLQSKMQRFSKHRSHLRWVIMNLRKGKICDPKKCNLKIHFSELLLFGWWTQSFGRTHLIEWFWSFFQRNKNFCQGFHQNKWRWNCQGPSQSCIWMAWKQQQIRTTHFQIVSTFLQSDFP